MADVPTLPAAGGERLQKFLARCGFGSRRHCEMLITAGKVTVNSAVQTVLGSRIDPEHDDVRVAGKRAVPRLPVYYLCHKPSGYLCSCDTRQGPTVIDYFARRGIRERVFPVGRLDGDTEGLLILTNDGELSNYLMHPRHHIGKTYRADLNAPLTGEDAAKLRAGIDLDGKMTAPAEVAVSPANPQRVFITIYEGRNRQVRRMFAALGYTIDYLQRVAYGNLKLADLPRGRHRSISRTLLLRMIGVPEPGESGVIMEDLDESKLPTESEA